MKLIEALALTAIIICMTSLIVSGAYFDYGTTAKATRVVSCLLGLIERITPYIMFAFLVYAGIKWMGSAENRQERLLAKKQIMMALIGFACVVGLLVTAAWLGIPADPDCMGGGVPGGGGGGTGWPFLQLPPAHSTQTGSTALAFAIFELPN
ncbi:MAG: hypothetical protein NTU61_00745 [Candidatus Altiarchaeota archaeon]|nr:hypothetical protein [Candidatus Altiarchaeota archaeon]